MDVDKKLGMSLDDLIKKTRKDVPKTAKPSANAVIQKKSGKTNVRRSEGKAKLGVKKTVNKRREERSEPRASTGRRGAAAVSKQGGSGRATLRRKSDEKMRPAGSSGRKTERRSGGDKQRSSSSNDKPSFARTVVVKKGPNAPADNRRKIKITNVPYDLTWKEVKEALSQAGHIERCDVERGEATLLFSSHREAERAIQTYDQGDMNGRKIRVAFA